MSARAAIGALALAFGPLIGGFISQHLHWGWIFLINVPVGVITMGIALVSLRESRDTSTAPRLDVPGLAASAGPSWPAAGHSPRLTRLAASSCQPGPAAALSIHQVAPAAT